MQIKFSLFLVLFSFSITMTKAYAFLCPNNFNQIDIGYSSQQVEQQCGKPDKKTSKEMTAEGAQTWDYYVSQTVLLNDNKPATGTLKTTISFDDAGKAINISVNGIGVGSSSICGQEIKLGDERDAVKAACGDPVFVNKQAYNQPKKYTLSEWTYGNTLLIFENEILKEKK